MFSLTFSNSVKPLHSVVAHQVRFFSRDRSFPNKLQHYLYRANLIDSIRLLDYFSPSLSSAWSIFATVLAKFHRSSQLKSLIGVINAGKFGHVQFSFMKFQVLEEYGHMNPPRCMCGGCNSEIEHGRSVDVLWHPECLWCDACHSPQTNSCPRGKFHNACYERYCYVCKEKKVPFFSILCYVCKEKKMKKFHQHPFWEERYCPAYESDGTPKCSSCERLEPMGTNYVKLSDGRWLCLQSLNKAEVEEKIDYQYEVITRGICLSEAQTIITSVSKRPRMGPHNQLIDMVTDSQRVVRDCEVTAILILYGLPRLMTGYILAHEMMHAYLRLNRYRNLNTVIEEGICQVLGHMWLESQTYAPVDATEAVASSSSASSTHTSAATHRRKVCLPPPHLPFSQCLAPIDSMKSMFTHKQVNDRIYLAHEMMHAYLRLNSSSSHTPAATASKTGACSDFEKKLVDFCKNQIETDDSPVYVCEVLQEIVQACVMKMELNRSSSFLMCTWRASLRRGGQDLVYYIRRDVPYEKADLKEERERFPWCVLLLGVEGDSEAFLWCHWCTLGAHVLGEVLPRSGRLKPRFRGSLAKAVSLKRSVKIAAVEDTVLRLTGW
ncbi:hypothetical protein DY000_02024182 [Brassica cretica]|uniref:Protein DA1-like domain-containing protein n=1 Tax=Brassica cretica TaxID=69181 RepID=A0ABQ7E540_BRACR|nr:hypothetical protein DY000_02024182 [Brassica cretica]